MRLFSYAHFTIIIGLLLSLALTHSSLGAHTLRVMPTVDTTKVVQLLDSARALVYSQPQNSRSLLEEAMIVSNELKYDAGKASCFNILGILSSSQGQLDSSRYFFEQSLNQWELQGNKKQISNLLGNLGVILAQQNQLAQAIEYNKKSLSVKLKLKDTIPIANGYNNLGNLYQDLGNTHQALYFQHKSLKLRIAIADSMRLSASYINLGDLHNSINTSDSAQYYGHRALVIANRNSRKVVMAYAYGVLAEYFYLKEQFDSALIYVDKSLGISLETGMAPLTEEETLLKSQIYVSQGKTYKALQTINSLQEYTDPIMRISALRIKAKVYKSIGDHKRAIPFYEKYNRLNDSTQAINQKNNIAEITANHFFELRELELTNKQQLEEKALTLMVNQEEEETARMYLIIALLAIMIIICIFLYLHLKRKNTLLQNQRQEIDHLMVLQKEVIEARTVQLLSNKHAISDYTFLNTHELKEPLQKIIDIVNVTDAETLDKASSLQSVKSSAEELETAIQKINRALHKH